jgi:hypothetical protein
MPKKLELDWSSAVVSDGKLTVAISAKPPKKWRESFERTAALLSHGKWKAALSVKKSTVEVATVSFGDEERVRQFLEGVVLEANGTLVSEDELFQDDHPENENGESAEPSPDAESTARFRAFATAKTG